MPAATITQPVKFFSENRGLKLVRQSQIDRMTAMGTMAMVAPEVSYQFELGWLEVLPGTDLLPDGPSWDEDTGQPEVQDAVAWLRSFSVVNGRFAEIVPEAPDAGELLLAVAEAEIAGDILRVEMIGDEEYATFARPEILERCKLARNRLKAKEDPKPEKPKA